MNTKMVTSLAMVFGAAGMIFGAYSAYKAHKMNERLNGVLDDISDNIDVDISDEIIAEATEKAVSKAADHAAQIAVASVKKEFEDDIKVYVQRAVAEQKGSMHTKIEEEITKRIGYIDISDAKKEVIAAAKSEAAERFQSDLDAILKNHNDELKNIQTIYSSIANSMKGSVNS